MVKFLAMVQESLNTQPRIKSAAETARNMAYRHCYLRQSSLPWSLVMDIELSRLAAIMVQNILVAIFTPE
jgi:hypothetical protein